MINWECTREDLDLIQKIAERSMQYFPTTDKLYLLMNVQATHCNGCKLRLNELLHAEEFDFIHDLTGICRFLNQKTGKLEYEFIPRFALKMEG